MTTPTIPEFLFPRLLLQEPGASRRIGELLGARAVPKGAVVVVADRAVHEIGLTTSAVSALTDAGYEPHIFADVDGEPEAAVVQQAADLVADIRSVAVVGIGGGSALDIAKLVAYSGSAGVRVDSLAGPVGHLDEFPVLALIPTTVGTGAEATRVAMFSTDGAKRAVLSSQFVPDIAILDPDLVAGLPAQVVAATALDALSHAIESMLSTTSNALTRTFSTDAARRIFAHLESAVGGDVQARSELQYASFLAGVSLNAGVVLGHSMSYVLASRFGLAHGVGCAIALPYCLAYNQEMPPNDATAIASDLLGHEGATLRDLAIAVQKLSGTVGLPTDLLALAPREGDAAELAASIVQNYPRPTNPVALQETQLVQLIEHLISGDLSAALTTKEGTS